MVGINYKQKNVPYIVRTYHIHLREFVRDIQYRNYTGRICFQKGYPNGIFATLLKIFVKK